MRIHKLISIREAVADSGFPRGGGANSPGGAPTYDFAKISQKLHEIERIWTGGARPKFYYVDPPLTGVACVRWCPYPCSNCRPPSVGKNTDDTAEITLM